VLYCSSWTIYK